MVFNKDPYLNRKDHCLDSLAFLRKLALNLVRLEPSNGFVGVGSVPAVVGARTGSVARGIAGQELNASVDGKRANQSEDAQGIPLVIVNRLAHDLKMCLAQWPVSERRYEPGCCGSNCGNCLSATPACGC